jgi:hypothetical protein
LQAAYDGSTVASTADLVATGDVLNMTFEGLTEAEARSVPDHQQAQRGRSFGFHPTTLATALTPAGFQWTYARPVTQDDVRAVAPEFYRLAVQFVGVWIRRASTPSGSTRIVLRTTAARALPAGTPSGSTILRLTTTAAGMATGTPSQSTLLLLKTTPAGLVSTPLNDPLYGSVLAHLPLTADKGFTDVSGQSVSITPQGGISIDASAGRWGAGSALLTSADGTPDWLSVELAQALGAGDYTIRFWFNLTTVDLTTVARNELFQITNEAGGIGSLPADVSFLNAFVIATSGWVYYSDNLNSPGSQVGTEYSGQAVVSPGSWYFFQQTRAAGFVRTSFSTVSGQTFITPVSADPVPTYIRNYPQTILDIGKRFGNSQICNGRFNDFQITLAARPHTVPTGPLPIF